MDTELDFDMETIGFETTEIDLLFELNPNLEAETPLSPPPLPEHTVSKLGDIWQCGPHRIGCGDARDTTFDDVQIMGHAALDARILACPKCGINGKFV